MPPAGNGGSGPPLSSAAIRPQSGWWPTTTTVSPRPSDDLEDGLGGGARRQPLVRLDGNGEGPAELGSGLARA